MRCLYANTDKIRSSTQSSKAKVLVCFASKQVFREQERGEGGGDKRGNCTKPGGQMRHVNCNMYMTLQHVTKQIGVRTWWKVD